MSARTLLTLPPAATSFFLGMLFMQFPYDYPILWTRSHVSAANPFDQLEAHMLLLHASPPLITRLLHIVIAVGLFGFFIKLFRPTESQQLFDGASLALYVVGIIIYITNIIKGLRQISAGEFYQPQLTDEAKVLGREDGLRVLCASNTILALVLVGVLVLQAGQWYAERKESQEMQKLEQKRQEKKAAAAGGSATAKKRN